MQEYGRSNPDLLDGLRARGAEVTPVRVYQWGLPEDDEPLREAARRLAAAEFQVALFTTAVQIEHLARVAREQGIEDQMIDGLRHCRVCSIGPTTTEALEEFGIHPAFEPSHPKMGILVQKQPPRLLKVVAEIEKAVYRARRPVHGAGVPAAGGHLRGLRHRLLARQEVRHPLDLSGRPAVRNRRRFRAAHPATAAGHQK